jgi:glycine cleavage system H protein
MRFTKTHEWVKTEGAIALVGISHYAQKELGEIVYVELPKIDASVRQGEEVVVLESTKAAVDLYSPLSGKIVEINIQLKATPELINQSAEDQGWLYKIFLSNPEELTPMLESQEYQKFIQQKK